MKEKVAALIDKLQELKNEGASISELSHYTKLLYAELMCVKGENDRNQSTRKVSVIMPGYDTRQEEKRSETPPVAVNNVAAHNESDWQKRENVSVQEEQEEKVSVQEKESLPQKLTVVAEETIPKEQASLWEKPQVAPDTPAEQPKQSPRELNDLIAEQRPSLNDRLKTSREEVANRLENASVKNLSQAIGLNEKFGYINELFRGDQSLYERSIRTINDCKDLNAALYWIDRELKIKFGWQEKDETVQRFYTLIRKRFS